MQKKSAVLRFIDEERAKGASDKEIRHQLLDRGWHMDIVQSAMDTKHDESITASNGVGKKEKAWPGTLNSPYIWAAVFGLLILFALFI